MLAFGSVGPGELVVILLIALIIFGKRMPEVARSAGKAMAEFKKGLQELQAPLQEDQFNRLDQSEPPGHDDEAPPASPPG